MILTIVLLNKDFVGPLFATYLIGDDAVQKLHNISERKHLAAAAATTIKKLHEVNRLDNKLLN